MTKSQRPLHANTVCPAENDVAYTQAVYSCYINQSLESLSRRNTEIPFQSLIVLMKFLCEPRGLSLLYNNTAILL